MLQLTRCSGVIGDSACLEAVVPKGKLHEPGTTVRLPFPPANKTGATFLRSGEVTVQEG